MSVMKNGNPGSLAVVSQWSEESCGQQQGGLEEMGTLDMSLFSTLPPPHEDDPSYKYLLHPGEIQTLHIQKTYKCIMCISALKDVSKC